MASNTLAGADARRMQEELRRIQQHQRVGSNRNAEELELLQFTQRSDVNDGDDYSDLEEEDIANTVTITGSFSSLYCTALRFCKLCRLLSGVDLEYCSRCSVGRCALTTFVARVCRCKCSTPTE